MPSRQTGSVWRAPAEDDDGVGAGTVAGAGYSAEVAHVGHTVKHDEQRTLTLLEQHGDEVLDMLIGDRGYERHYALMVLEGDAVELFHRNALDGYLCTSQGVEKLACQVALHVALDEYTVDVFAGFDSLDDGADAEDIV